MKKRFQYTFLGIATIVIHALTLISAYMVYSPIRQFADAMNSKDSFSGLSSLSGLSGNSIALGSKAFIFGLVATIVISIIFAIYYIYEERKLIVLISSLIGLVETLLFLITLGSVAQLLTSGLSSLLFSSGDSLNKLSSVGGMTTLAFIVILLGLIFQVIVVLQLFNVLHLTFLVPYMPSHYQTTQINTNESKQEQPVMTPTPDKVEEESVIEDIQEEVITTQDEGGQNHEENL